MAQTGDRRQAPRIPVELHVEFRHLGRPLENYEDLTRNISAGGVFLETTVTFAVGTIVDLDVAPGPGLRPIKLRAEVVRVEEEPVSTGSKVTLPARGMALKFFDTNPDEHARLMTLAKHMAAKEIHGNGVTGSR